MKHLSNISGLLLLFFIVQLTLLDYTKFVVGEEDATAIPTNDNATNLADIPPPQVSRACQNVYN